MQVRQLAFFPFKSCHGLLATTNQEQLLQICRLEDTTQANYPRHFAQVPARPKTQEIFCQDPMPNVKCASYFEQ